MSPKIKRLESTIIRVLSDILNYEVKHPDIDFLTLTATKLTTDLSHLKVYYTLLNNDEETKERVALALEKSNSFIRTMLVQKVKMRKSPAIHFIYDESLERGNKILIGLRKIIK